VASEHALRPDRTLNQIATTVGADAVEDVFGAIDAKGAFVGADKRIETFRRKVPVAAFAIRSQFQHRRFLVRYQSIFKRGGDQFA
jgi:hypothetical protein